MTNEKKANLRVCGFGSGGRLGLGQHTQYNLVPVPQLQARITAVALGQDHTIALTENGDVLSWGMNRFSQLGYVIEAASSGAPSGKRLLRPRSKFNSFFKRAQYHPKVPLFRT